MILLTFVLMAGSFLPQFVVAAESGEAPAVSENPLPAIDRSASSTPAPNRKQISDNSR